MYAIVENEKIAEQLETIMSWFREEPAPHGNLNEEERKRLLTFADQLEAIILRPYEEFVQDHYKRLEKEEEEKDEIKKEFKELMDLSKEELVERYMKLKEGK